ncbi:hypothetical protein [Solidesulfovibrio sp.]|uniref:hypothetical protein n=1 Tax=Solidesulfovibrio sp. TaxID=2910990 RepID=UPI002B214694|nr:hypothetical protein [Solidesulfovibrio sp.]MEA5090786.1 hypothetical protein [Solidesulfovibrio sp.]
MSNMMRKRCIVALGPMDFLGHDLVEFEAVVRAGELVGDGEFGQRLVGGRKAAAVGADAGHHGAQEEHAHAGEQDEHGDGRAELHAAQGGQAGDGAALVGLDHGAYVLEQFVFAERQDVEELRIGQGGPAAVGLGELAGAFDEKAHARVEIQRRLEVDGGEFPGVGDEGLGVAQVGQQPGVVVFEPFDGAQQVGADIAPGFLVVGGGQEQALGQHALGEQALGAAYGRDFRGMVDGGHDVPENGVGGHGQEGGQGQGRKVAQRQVALEGTGAPGTGFWGRHPLPCRPVRARWQGGPAAPAAPPARGGGSEGTICRRRPCGRRPGLPR